MQSPVIGRTIAIAIIVLLVGWTAFRSLSARPPAVPSIAMPVPALDAPLAPAVRETDRVESLSEPIPITIRRHQTLVSDGEFLPPEPQLPALFGRPELHVSLVQLERAAVCIDRAAVQTQRPGILPLHEEAKPTRRLDRAGETKAVQIEAVIAILVRIMVCLSASPEFEAEPQPLRQVRAR